MWHIQLTNHSHRMTIEKFILAVIIQLPIRKERKNYFDTLFAGMSLSAMWNVLERYGFSKAKLNGI